MIVTRSWLGEFIDMDGISNEKLYDTFNAIGLEVDTITSYEIAEKVVVGKIVSCKKHPDADKLNVCQVDVGSSVKQIVCGAANVLDAEYVAVALIGAKLPGDFEIKFATLRGVESEGMICASSELGLPDTGKGIMILDDSIGELRAGRELGRYEKVTDTMIELELTANRGDCLSVYGVARDLSVALDRELIPPMKTVNRSSQKMGIGRIVDLHIKGDIEADLHYSAAVIKKVNTPFLILLRLGMVGVDIGNNLSNLLSYATHSTGVILRAYDGESLKKGNKITLLVDREDKGIVSISSEGKPMGMVGINQNPDTVATDSSELVLFEASYIHPDLLVEAIAGKNYRKDDLYYRTSRGSEPDLQMGMSYLSFLMERYTASKCYEGELAIESNWEPVKIAVDFGEINSLVGQEIGGGKVAMILKNLGFEIRSKQSDKIGVVVPRFRHDIKNIQDIAEEIVRIVGINNIDVKALEIVEKNQINETISHYAFKKSLRQCAASAGFNENISYIFSDRSKLDTYGFDLLPKELDLANPIVEELNTLRSTILVNLLEAVKRNVNYTAKSIGLFEIGASFDSGRSQKELISFVFSGYGRVESILNSGKPKMIDFASFVEKLGAVLGSFELVECREENGLIHPYQSADILVRGVKCGYVSKLHPVAQDEYGIYDTFIAELEMDRLYPVHINAEEISKFQGVYKDLSLVIDKTISYLDIKDTIKSLNLSILKRWYPVDVYEDEELGDKKSLTVRFFIQSMEKTLEDEDIESVIAKIVESLEQTYQARLR